MEKTMNSRTLSWNSSKSSCNHKLCEDEESGWTMYLEDTFIHRTNSNSSFSSSILDLISLSLASPTSSSSSPYSDGRKRRRCLVVDDDLEDTACSQEKSSFSGKVERRSDIDLGFIGRDSESTLLSTKGLCLVPLSTVVNYFG